MLLGALCRHSLYIEFRSYSASGLIFLAENPDMADMVSVYMRKGQLTFARRCRTGSAFEVYRKNFNNDQWHTVQWLNCKVKTKTCVGMERPT